jgi:hypothetical protein
MMFGTPRSNNDDKRSFFPKVVAFCTVVVQLEAIFGHFKKTRINHSKIGLY